MFFGPRLNTVFASRWKALLWAAMVMLTAYCSIPDRDPAAGTDPAAGEQASRADDAGADMTSAADLLERRRDEYDRQRRLDRATR